MAKKPKENTDVVDGTIPATVYLEKSIVREIDRMGKETRRSRSQMIAVLIDEGIAARSESVSAK